MTLASCILFYSLFNGIDPMLTKSIIQVESNGNPFAMGDKGDSGLMQIRHQFVPESRLQLLNPCTNIMRGVHLLKQAKEKCKHKVNKTWVVCYNLGIRGGSRIRYPDKFKYYKKVMSYFKK